MKSTFFSKNLLSASIAFIVLGSSTVAFAAATTSNAAKDWVTVPGSACFAEDRAKVSSFAAPGTAEIMLKAGEVPQWVVCPVPRAGLLANTVDDGNGKYNFEVHVDKATATTPIFCYSSLLEKDGSSGSWLEIKGVTANQNLSGHQLLDKEAVGVDAAGVELGGATGDKDYEGAIGVACLLHPGDKVISITVEAQ